MAYLGADLGVYMLSIVFTFEFVYLLNRSDYRHKEKLEGGSSIDGIPIVMIRCEE